MRGGIVHEPGPRRGPASIGAPARCSARALSDLQHEWDAHGYHVHVEALQNCQPEPPPDGVQHWNVEPDPDMHWAPGASWQLPQLQDAVHVSTPHIVAVPDELRSHPKRVAPGEHVPPPLHVPYAPHVPQAQLAVHVRVRDCDPRLQLPHARVSVST